MRDLVTPGFGVHGRFCPAYTQYPLTVVRSLGPCSCPHPIAANLAVVRFRQDSNHLLPWVLKKGPKP